MFHSTRRFNVDIPFPCTARKASAGTLQAPPRPTVRRGGLIVEPPARPPQPRPCRVGDGEGQGRMWG
ncbi:hypothetical protein GCM10009727_34770 [Actinomadura napierensis]|uniref:Uncharacterized protein n=1 Tax=Actinomadura napierensis TaxID=267854 RepID=A0ABN2Z9B9_9ACTN